MHRQQDLTGTNPIISDVCGLQFSLCSTYKCCYIKRLLSKQTAELVISI